MTAKTKPTRVVRALTITLGLAIVGYAVSDHPMYGGGPGFDKIQVAILGIGALLACCALLPFKWNKRVLLLAFSGLISLMAAELVANFVLGPTFRPPYQVDDKLLFKLRPSCYSVTRRLEVNGGDRVLHRINSYGYRGEELAEPGSAKRVIVYGDSFIHAPYSPDEETFVAQLDGLLTDRIGSEVEVINAGISSYGPDQISFKMEDDLPTLKPDLVIVAIFAGNDYGDLLRNKMFRVTNDGALQPNNYSLHESVRVKLELNLRESILRRAVRKTIGGMRRRESLYSLIGDAEGDPDLALMEFWRARAESEYKDFILDGNDVVTNTHQDHYSADISLEPTSPSAQYKVRLMGAVMRRIKSVAEANGARLAFLFIPHPINVCDGYEGGGKVDTSRYTAYDRHNLIAPLEQVASSESVPYLSLFDPYRETDAKQLYFKGGDDHWNAAGQKLAAELMAEHLLEKKLLEGN